MSKSKKPETKEEQGELLATDVLSALNKQFKNDFNNPMTFLADASLVEDWISTGVDELDLAISNRPNGGIPCGCITEIFGEKGSSKSLLGVEIMANCQKMGGLPVLFDTENAVGMLEFFEAIGLDPKKTLYTDKLRCLEDVYAAVESIITQSIEKNSDKPLVIVVDSVMGATTRLELESDYDKEGWATSKAIINSKAMRKFPSLIAGRKIAIVLINQVRDNLGAMPGSPQTRTSGGRGIAFTASVRLETKVVSRSAKNQDGETIEVKIEKNRFGPPRKKVRFDVYYDSGVDNFGSWFNMLKEFGLLKSAGSLGWAYDFVNPETAELTTLKFKEEDFKKLLESKPELKQTVYRQICDNYIMKYKDYEGSNQDEEQQLETN